MNNQTPGVEEQPPIGPGGWEREDTKSGSARRGEGLRIALAGLLGLAAIAQAAAYWPGLMTWDAIRQYGQALDGTYDDWHPPAMEWLWRQLDRVATGPAPMLLLQLALYWGGFALLIAYAVRNSVDSPLRTSDGAFLASPPTVGWEGLTSNPREGSGAGRRAIMGVLVAFAALLPIPLALMGAVLKDCLMAGALLLAAGILAWLPERGQWWRRGAAIALLLSAATLRFNALPACLPLMLGLFPADWRRTPVRLVGSAIVASLALAAAMPLANRAIGAERSGVELSLVTFDLGGITERSGVDQFPPLDVADPVAVNHGCYSPVKWDAYSWWVDRPCPIGFERMRQHLARTHERAYAPWLRAIDAHPLAYAAHRLAHFNINVRFLVRDEVERPVQLVSAPNDWGYREANGPVQRAIDAAARASAHSPLGWPVWWMMLALGCLTLSPHLPSRRLVLPLAASALLYGLGYAMFSVAAELRYHLWTMLGAAIAAAFAIGDLAGGALPPRRRMIAAAGPLLLVTTLCAAWRLLSA